MKPFDESAFTSPIHSDVESKLRTLLIELGNADKIIGIQVCAYKDGQVIIDTAAGVMGIDDPRPVQPDTLFTVYSTTKGITAGLIHLLADQGKLKLDEPVANIWPEFGTNGKDKIKVNHILNHTSGLHNALAGISDDILCDWDECLKRIAMAKPETEPGCEQFYHHQSYGWLCGGIIEHASGKKFQEVLEEAFVRPLHIEGELYIGISPGVESRLATVTADESELNAFGELMSKSEVREASKAASTLKANILADIINLSNTLNFRRAILPAANGQFSARALARYYAALADGGIVPTHSSTTLPPLGSHPHHPELQKDESTTTTNDETVTKIFRTPKSKLHDAFMAREEYNDLILPGGRFGMGFGRIITTDGSVIGFGHPGLGGSVGYCDVNNRFSIGVTFNKLSFGDFTGKIVRLICSELDLPVPEEYAAPADSFEKPVFN